MRPPNRRGSPRWRRGRPPGGVGALGRGALLARVQDPVGAGRDRRLDRVAVQAHHVGRRVVAGDQEHLVGAGEGVAQGGRGIVGGLSYAHTAVREVPRPGDVAHADADLLGRQALEEVLDGGPVEGAGGTGDDDHVRGPSLRARTGGRPCGTPSHKLTSGVNFASVVDGR